MRLGGDASYVIDINSRDELEPTLAWADERKLPVIMIGVGSNIIWRDEGFPGVILVNKIMGFNERQEGPDYFITVGAGENWDDVVERTVAKGMSGIEALSAIPGTAGATPMQNVGAYGQEIANTLVSVEAYDRQTKQFVVIPAADCAFGYRTSRFKTTDRGRFFITNIALHLQRTNPKPPFYKDVEKYLTELNIHQYTPAIIREAVMAIRRIKLPDPSIVANNGSFFANPIVSQEHFKKLEASYPGMPNWPTSDGQVKLPAAWLLEQAGLKDMHDAETGMATLASQPLVLVNEHAEKTAQLLQFKKRIVDTIKQQFDIELEQEPELLP